MSNYCGNLGGAFVKMLILLLLAFVCWVGGTILIILNLLGKTNISWGWIVLMGFAPLTYYGIVIGTGD